MPDMIRNAEQARKAEKVLSMLHHKMKKGTATDEDRERYRVGMQMVLIWDWGTESYQNHVPNMIAAAEERKRQEQEVRRQKVAGSGLIARRTVPDSGNSGVVPTPGRPALTRRAGKFAV